MNFTLRVLAVHDVECAQQLFALFQVAFEKNPAAPPSPDQLRRLLARPDFHVVVALLNGAVVGGSTAYELEMLDQTRELFIYDVAVAAAQRRQGIGRALIEAARELCRSRGFSALYVPALADDARAVAFYEATGLKREDVAWFVEEFGDTHA